MFNEWGEVCIRFAIILLEGRDVIYQNNQPIALLWLCEALDLPRTASFAGNVELPIVILKNAEHRIAFIVDELAGEQEIVVKGLGDQLTRIAGLSGATILGTGEVVLILNAKDLIAMAMRGGYTNIREKVLKIRVEIFLTLQMPGRFNERRREFRR